METGTKMMLILVAVLFIAPMLLMFLDFALNNWLPFLLSIGGIITIIFVYKFVSKGDHSASTSFRGIP